MSLAAVSPAKSFEILSDHLVFWSVYDPSIKTDMSSCGVRTPDGWYLIDPAPIEPAALESLPQTNKVAAILLTNENHERFSGELSRAKNCPVWGQESLREGLDVKASHYFKDNHFWSDCIQAVCIPGASKSETAFYVSSLKLLVIGDALINLKETGFAFLPDKYCQDCKLAKSSLEVLLKLQFDVIMFAHGRPLVVDVEHQLQRLLNKT